MRYIGKLGMLALATAASALPVLAQAPCQTSIGGISSDLSPVTGNTAILYAAGPSGGDVTLEVDQFGQTDFYPLLSGAIQLFTLTEVANRSGISMGVTGWFTVRSEPSEPVDILSHLQRIHQPHLSSVSTLFQADDVENGYAWAADIGDPMWTISKPPETNLRANFYSGMVRGVDAVNRTLEYLGGATTPGLGADRAWVLKTGERPIDFGQGTLWLDVKDDDIIQAASNTPFYVCLTGDGEACTVEVESSVYVPDDPQAPGLSLHTISGVIPANSYLYILWDASASVMPGSPVDIVDLSVIDVVPVEPGTVDHIEPTCPECSGLKCSPPVPTLPDPTLTCQPSLGFWQALGFVSGISGDSCPGDGNLIGGLQCNYGYMQAAPRGCFPKEGGSYQVRESVDIDIPLPGGFSTNLDTTLVMSVPMGPGVNLCGQCAKAWAIGVVCSQTFQNREHHPWYYRSKLAKYKCAINKDFKGYCTDADFEVKICDRPK